MTSKTPPMQMAQNKFSKGTNGSVIPRSREESCKIHVEDICVILWQWTYLKVDKEDDNPKVDESMGGGDQVSLLVNNKDESSQDACLGRAEWKLLQLVCDHS